MKFSIGYTSYPGFLDFLKENKKYIESVYFPLPKDVGVSGRDIPQQKNYQNEIIDFLKVCKLNNIKAILLLNGGCEGKDNGNINYINKLIKYIKTIYSYGIYAISLTNLLYIQIIKNNFENIKIYASVNCDIYTLQHAVYLKKLKVDVITLNRSINRDLELIKKIKEKTGLKIQLIVNEGCFGECPFYRTHSLIQTHCIDSESNLIKYQGCYSYFKENLKSIFKINIIRPEDMKYYSGIVDTFKLSTRGDSLKQIKFYLDTYNKGYYNGNYLDLFDFYQKDYVYHKLNYIDNSLLTKNDFFNKIKSCKMDCKKCNICDIFLKE